MVRLAAVLAIAVLFAPMSGVRAAMLSAPAMYADAQAKERAVRRVLGSQQPTEALARAVRTVLRTYDALVRQYPTSSYCDDALWYAAQLAIDASKRVDDPTYAVTAVRYLTRLIAEYPSSKHVKPAAGVLSTISVPPADPERQTAGYAAAGGVSDGLPVATAGTLDVAAAPSEAGTTPSGSGRVAPAADHETPKPPAIATLTGIRRAVLPDVVRLTLELDAEVPFHHEELTGPARLFFDLRGTRASADLRNRTLRFDGDRDIVRQVRIGRRPRDTTRVVLETEGASCSVVPTYSPYRLVVDCVRLTPPAATPAVAAVTRPTPRTPGTLARKMPMAPPPPIGARSIVSPMAIPPVLFARSAVPPLARALPAGRPRVAASEFEAAAVPDVVASSPAVPVSATLRIEPPVSAARNLDGGLSIARQLGLTVSRIVIDPGHGGHDPGARGRGLTEAELVLDIALRLEALLSEDPSVEVILTRRTDTFVPLEERTAIANRETADLFLSIHANASRAEKAAGIETYFLNFANTPAAAAVAARENAASGQPMSALPDFVKAIALNNKADESRDLATLVQRSLMQKLRVTNRAVRDLGVKQAPFVVLIGASMPSVLTEVSFVTNAREAKLLKGSAYRQRIAEALFAAVQKYQASLSREQALATHQ